MAIVSLVGLDTAGGTIGGGGHGVTIDGHPIAVNGDPVAAHPPCPQIPAHCSAVTANGDPHATIDGIPIILAGDQATCGHSATGSSGCDISPK